MLNLEKAEQALRDLIVAFGDDPEREGLKETPQRAARMFAELLEGMQYTNAQIAEMFSKTFTADFTEEGRSESENETEYTDSFGYSSNTITVKGIEFFSLCEHHLALMYDMTAEVSYIPHGRILGLSKIARICDMVGKRLQLQERIAADIAEIISLAAFTPDVQVTVKGVHSCMTARGIKKTTAQAVTVCKLGAFNVS